MRGQGSLTQIITSNLIESRILMERKFTKASNAWIASRCNKG